MKIDFRVVGITAVLLLAPVVVLSASPTCTTLVKTKVLVPVRNKVSKKTADAWAKWRVGHPTWKQNASLVRPRTIMVPQESSKRMNVACETAPAIKPNDLGLPPARPDLTSFMKSDLPVLIDPPPVLVADLAPPAGITPPPFAGEGPVAVGSHGIPPFFFLPPIIPILAGTLPQPSGGTVIPPVGGVAVPPVGGGGGGLLGVPELSRSATSTTFALIGGMFAVLYSGRRRQILG